MSSRLRFIDKNNSAFFATVRQRVDDYFQENHLSKHANFAMWLKIAFFLGGLIFFYCLILFGNFTPWQMLGLSVLLGMFAAFNGFNVCHDAIHGSLSKNQTVNKIFSLVFNIIGANAYVWSITHNVVHHTYTNIPGHDEDIEVAPGLIRLSPAEPVKSVFRFQHLYAFLLYGLASLSWVFRKDYKKFFQNSIGSYDNSQRPAGELFNLFFFKALYYILFIVLPLVMLDITWWQFLIGFVVMHISEGFVLGLVFQLAHVVEGTEFPEANEDGNIEEAWAAHQMRTTANFAIDNPLVNFFCGGLNMQIEHHLFAKICHIHYPKLAPIVRQTALEFGLPYIENKTFGSALLSHYKMLKKFGKEDYENSLVTQPQLS
jgi:linoleoyl-CoA desaturase